MASDKIFDAATSRAYPALYGSNPLLSLAEDKSPIYVGMKRVTGPNWKPHWTTYVKHTLAEKSPDMSAKDIEALTHGLQKYLGIGIGTSAGVTPWLRGMANNPLADPLIYNSDTKFSAALFRDFVDRPAVNPFISVHWVQKRNPVRNTNIKSTFESLGWMSALPTFGFMQKLDQDLIAYGKRIVNKTYYKRAALFKTKAFDKFRVLSDHIYNLYYDVIVSLYGSGV